MDDSILSKLPVELRDRIYEFVVTQGAQVAILIKLGAPTSSRLDLRFMRTCRRLRAEANPIFYRINGFTIVTKFLEGELPPSSPQARRPFAGVRKWLDAIGPQNAGRLRKVCIDLGWYTVVGGEHDMITEYMALARDEIRLCSLPSDVVVLRAAYYLEVFPSIGRIMRYIDIPLNDREAAKRMLEKTTRSSIESTPPMAFNRELLDRTMDLFQAGILGIVM